MLVNNHGRHQITESHSLFSLYLQLDAHLHPCARRAAGLSANTNFYVETKAIGWSAAFIFPSLQASGRGQRIVLSRHESPTGLETQRRVDGWRIRACRHDIIQTSPASRKKKKKKKKRGPVDSALSIFQTRASLSSIITPQSSGGSPS